MTLSLRAAGSWAYAASGSVTPTVPAHQIGDMLIARVAYKSSAIATCAASTATSGWLKVGEYHNGTTNSGNGTGSVAVAAFWKIATATNDAGPTIDFSQTVTQVGHEAQAYQKTLGYWVDPVGNGGPDTTAGTSLSHTIVSHVSVTAGDLVDFFHGVCDDGTLTVPTITQASVTFAAVVESPATAGTNTSGADGCYDGGYRIASSGTSSAAAVETGTLAVSESSSAAWMTRLRETNTATVVLGLLTSTSALYAPTVIRPAPLFTAQLATLGFVAHYRMGEASGSVIDSSATANHGTVLNDNGTIVRDVTGGLGNGQDDGAIGIRTFGRIDVAHNAVLNVGDSFSIGFGYKRGTGGGNSAGVYAKGVGATDILIYFSSSDQLRLADSATGASVVYIDPTITTTLNDNNWHFVVVTKSGATSKWYFDGGDVTQTGTNVTFADNSTAVIIGAYNDGTDRFNGDLDEFFISDTAFTAQNVTDLYDSWLNGAATGPTTITLGLLDGAPALYAPTVTPKNLLTLGLLDGAPALYAPTILAKNTLTLGLLDAAPALYAPTVIIDQFVTLGLIDGAPALYAPTLTPKNLLALGLLDGAPALYAPALTPTNLLTVPLLDGAPALYEPTVASTGGTQAVTLGLLDAGPALYTPTATPTNTLTLPFMGGDAYAATVIADGPVAYWRLGEATGAPQDSVGTNHVTGVGGTPTYGVAGPLPGDANTAVTFDGTTEYFLVSNGGLLNNVDVVSVEAWVNRGATGQQRAIFSRGRQSYYLRINSAGNLEFLKSFAAAIVASTVPVPTGWSHVVATKSGTTTKLYIDGVDVTGTVTNATLGSSAMAASIGADDAGAGDRSNASLDEVAVYNYALTPAQVLAHANGKWAAGLFAPTVVVDQFVTLPLLEANIFFDPADFDPADFETTPLYAPVVTQTGGPTTVTLGLLDGGAATYAPAIIIDQFVTLGLIDGAPALYAPTVTPTNTLTLGLLDAAAALYAPTVTPKNLLTLGLLTSSSALYAPTILPQPVGLTLGLLDAGPALYALTVTTKNTLTLGLLDAGPALFTPTLAAKSTLTLGLLTSTSALYAPTILPQPVAITVPLLTSASALYAPTIVAGPLGITVPLLDAAPALYAPSITATQIIALGLLDGAPALFAPTVVPAPVGVTLGLIDATRALYAPSLGFALGLPLLASTSALYPPVINPAAVALGLALLDAGAALYAIVVTQGAVPHAIAVRMFVSDSRVGVLATSSLDGTLVVDSRAPEVATAHAGATMVADDRSAP